MAWPHLGGDGWRMRVPRAQQGTLWRGQLPTLPSLGPSLPELGDQSEATVSTLTQLMKAYSHPGSCTGSALSSARSTAMARAIADLGHGRPALLATCSAGIRIRPCDKIAGAD